jgi:ABC-type spermidine/putrescine transport system permease subunit I
MIGNIIKNQFTGTARNQPFGAALGTALLFAFAVTYYVVQRKQRAAE